MLVNPGFGWGFPYLDGVQWLDSQSEKHHVFAGIGSDSETPDESPGPVLQPFLSYATDGETRQVLLIALSLTVGSFDAQGRQNLFQTFGNMSALRWMNNAIDVGMHE